MTRKSILAACVVLFLMSACGGPQSYFGVKNQAFYVPSDFEETQAAIDQAQKSQGAQYCPEMIAKANELATQGAQTYWACKTKEGKALLAQARQTAKDAESCQPPPPVAVAPPPPPPPPAPKELTFERVYFDFDKSNLTPNAEEVLQANLKILQDNPSVVVSVWGHTDGKGSEAYNLKLSQRRATAVKNWLVSHGISADRIQVDAYGKTKPREANDTEDGRALNRRVGFHVISQ
jgi:outer membrane protein OmpA-like peptidoglycan-associated protein